MLTGNIKITAERRRGRGFQYRLVIEGGGERREEWLSGRQVKETLPEELAEWVANRSN